MDRTPVKEPTRKNVGDDEEIDDAAHRSHATCWVLWRHHGAAQNLQKTRCLEIGGQEVEISTYGPGAF